MIGVYWFITSLTAIASFFWNLSLLNPEELIELMPWIRFYRWIVVSVPAKN